MTISEMQKIYFDIAAFKDAMRNHACDSTFTNKDFYNEYRDHADKMCEAMGILSAHITMKQIQEKVYG